MKKLVVSVCLPVWYTQTFEIEDDEIIGNVIKEETGDRILEEFDFSEAEELAEWKLKNMHQIIIKEQDNNEYSLCESRKSEYIVNACDWEEYNNIVNEENWINAQIENRNNKINDILD